MKLEKKLVRSINIFIVLITIFIFTGCSTTVIPKPVITNAISWDNGEQNGGFVGFISIGKNTYGVITSNARDRYNSLITIYSTNFIPPLIIDAGITPGSTTNTFIIDAQHLSYFATMNRWRKNKIVSP